MSIDDRLAIHEIIGRYSYTDDGLDADGFAGLFAEARVREIFVPGGSSPCSGFSPERRFSRGRCCPGYHDRWRREAGGWRPAHRAAHADQGHEF